MFKRTVKSSVFDEYFNIKDLIWASIGIFGGHYDDNKKTCVLDPEKKVCVILGRDKIWGIAEKVSYPIISINKRGARQDNKELLGRFTCYSYLSFKGALKKYGICCEKSILSACEILAFENLLIEKEKEVAPKYPITTLDLDNSELTFQKH